MVVDVVLDDAAVVDEDSDIAAGAAAGVAAGAVALEPERLSVR